MRALLLVLSLVLTALLGPGSMAQQSKALVPDQAKVALTVDGDRLDMVVHIYKPAGPGPFPTVLYLHGRPPNRSERADLRQPVAPGHAEWWVRRGFAVVAPLRPGYGATGGPDLEDTGARWRGDKCSGNPDFLGVAAKSRVGAFTTYQWAVQQPWVRKDSMVIEGHSLGGLAALATAALNPPGLRGVVNFSGGTAGNPFDAPGRSCRPEVLADTYRELGRKVRVPSLWLYAQNDAYWGAQAPKLWHAAFWSGGSDSEFVMTAAVEGTDGHHLLMEGADLWIEHVDAFIRKVGLARP